MHQVKAEQLSDIGRSPKGGVILEVWVFSISQACAYGGEAYPDLRISGDDLSDGREDFDVAAGAFAGLGMG